MKIQIYNKDCIEGMKDLPDNSIDSIVTDPPYGLTSMTRAGTDQNSHNKFCSIQARAGFMNKKWDGTGIEYNIDMWKECLRILKPGGHLLSFGGSRTYHRMTCAIEDAGFQIRDQIMWVYGEGFPKSLNVKLNINKQIDNLYNDNIWIKNCKNVLIAENQLLKNIIKAGENIEKENFVAKNVHQNINLKKLNAPVSVVEKYFTEVLQLPQGIKNVFVIENVEQNLLQSQQSVKFAAKKLKKEEVKLENLNIFIVGCNVKELLNESIKEIIKEEEVQRIFLGKWLPLNEMNIDANFVELIENLKLTILKKFETIQNSDMILQMGLSTAIPVIITKSTMECLILNMVDILKEINNNLHDGIGSNLKPAHEPIVVARKPLSEKTIVENILKWGVGGINIDDCRIATNELTPRNNKVGRNGWINSSGGYINPSSLGRWPANLIHDGSEEVIERFPNSDGCQPHKITSKNKKYDNWGSITSKKDDMIGYEGKGSASRFFYCAKSSQKERDAGLEKELDKVGGMFGTKDKSLLTGSGNIRNNIMKNNHPTVKPIKLMEYLIKLVTPPNGIVLDPFMGSGTTGLAAINLCYNFIGYEKEKEYYQIARARLRNQKELITCSKEK